MVYSFAGSSAARTSEDLLDSSWMASSVNFAEGPCLGCSTELRNGCSAGLSGVASSCALGSSGCFWPCFFNSMTIRELWELPLLSLLSPLPGWPGLNRVFQPAVFAAFAKPRLPFSSDWLVLSSPGSPEGSCKANDGHRASSSFDMPRLAPGMRGLCPGTSTCKVSFLS